ncbi:MAG TPA: EAL domain-containing protein [Janthinobacterium sp.]|nr:EAL domain-containing protein [Janthinobacterium sp.]
MTLFLIGLCAAVTALLLSQQRGHRRERRLRHRGEALQRERDAALALLQALPAAVVGIDAAGLVSYLNPHAATLAGRPGMAAGGLPVGEMLAVQQGGAAVDIHRQVQACQDGARVLESGRDARLRRLDGSSVDVQYSCAPLAPQPGAVILLHDVSERRDVEARLEFIAHHDGLTGLPNRLLFQIQLEHGIACARRHCSLLAVLFIDIDRFKQINDSLGHEAGDQVLVQFASRLQSCVRQVDTVARQGGDEFVILLTEMRTAQDAEGVAAKILAALAAPFQLGRHSLAVAASIGMAMYPDDAGEVDALIKKADLAMYASKRRGLGACQRYAPGMQARAYSRMILETALRHALEQDEFILTYQPKLDLKTQRIAGVKALIRWRHPELGLVMPLDFMPILEESALILPVGAWVLATAVAQARRWIDMGQPLTVSVNLSTRQFYQKDIAASVAALLVQAGVPGRFIELEINEGILIDRNQNCEAVLQQFKQLGMGISISNFGTGYASLNYVRRFPVDTVKIDKSFIDGLRRGLPAAVPAGAHEGAGGERRRDGRGAGDDGALVSAIIAMAHTLKMRVIAGGVETSHQLEQLTAMGCDEAFGFCLSRAVAPAEIEALVRSRLERIELLPQTG